MGFCRRESKLKPSVFFELLFYCASRTENSSLSFMVSYLESKFGIQIRKQSLAGRFTSQSVDYIQSVLKEVISERLNFIYSDRLLTGFKRVRIKDSSKIMVPSNMESNYPGCGGDIHSRSKAGLSIQYEYDLKRGEITALSITAGNRNDRADAGQSASQMDAGDLIIRDLGYFSTDVFEKCLDSKAFFLSRLDASTNVYDMENKLISFKSVYKEMSESGILQKEMNVFIGKKKRVPVRLILGIVPEEVYKQRIRQKTQKSKGQGRGQLTEETKTRSRFSLFITNADREALPMEHAFPLYRLRWQIELNFKIWKSVFKIDKLQQMKEERYITLLLTKLLLIIINMQIIYSVQQFFADRRPDKIPIISLNKAMKTFSSLFDEIFSMFRQNYRKMTITAQNIMKRLSENHWLESKKKKQCFPEIIELFICKSEK
ncbi:hypothetical protein EZS27_000695 [termite gut metagenome]|uniref:Transposase IS4-like domain-containing protein n=2 Tax=termite gut metagenome TaxID=433724 RepID=A0A5J4T1F8_9ZZZZ